MADNTILIPAAELAEKNKAHFPSESREYRRARNRTPSLGHGRVEAARTLGMSRVPTIRLENLNEDQIRAYILADNKLAENAGWTRRSSPLSCSIS